MSDDKFARTLRLNILELFKPSAARMNRKSFNLIDLENMTRPLYMLAQRKPTYEEVVTAVENLQNKSLLQKVWVDGIEYWSMSPTGQEALQAIYDGDEVDY